MPHHRHLILSLLNTKVLARTDSSASNLPRVFFRRQVFRPRSIGRAGRESTNRAAKSRSRLRAPGSVVPALTGSRCRRLYRQPLSPPFSVLGEVIIQLPLRYLRDVFLPFQPLGLEEVLRDVLAERFLDDRVLLELVACFFEIVRQIVDLEPPLLAV